MKDSENNVIGRKKGKKKKNTALLTHFFFLFTPIGRNASDEKGSLHREWQEGCEVKDLIKVHAN